MQKILFNRDGNYLMGKHRGTHASKLPMDYVSWASLNIDGFKAQYGALARGETLPKPKPVSVKPFSQERPQRRYFLSRSKRMYSP
jgi:hypothetical protein